MPVTALSSTNVDRPVGGEWVLTVLVTDVDCEVVDAVPVVTVTLPDGTTATPTVDALSTGVYRATYILAAAGRYVARAVATGHGVADFVAFTTAVVPAGGMPTLEDLRGDPDAEEEDFGYLGENSWTDTDIQDALDAEAAAQRRCCNVPAAYPADLREALMRRVLRNLNMRGQPIALLDGDEPAQRVMPGRDQEVLRLERNYPRLPVGA